MQVKTSELTNEAIDWAVAKCEGWKVSVDEFFKSQLANCKFSYSAVWAKGGPIIERERIGLWPSDSREGMWAARPDYKVYPERLTPAYGSTPLIAAMRCYVASKLGDTVDIPEGLI